MSDTKTENDTQSSDMTKKDIAFHICTKWDGLLKPTWPRKLLIDYGTAIMDKISLSKMDPERLDTLLPYLSIVAEYLGKHVAEKFYSEFIAFLKTIGASQEIMSEAEKLKPGTLSREEIAYYIRTMWDADLKPDWKRDDLIDLGMAVFTKTTLAKIDQKKLGKLLPCLSIAAETFGQQVATKFATKFAPILKMIPPAEPTQTVGEPNPTPTQAPTPPQEPTQEPAPVIEQGPDAAQTPAESSVSQQSVATEPPSEQPAVEPQGENNG